MIISPNVFALMTFVCMAATYGTPNHQLQTPSWSYAYQQQPSSSPELPPNSALIKK